MKYANQQTKKLRRSILVRTIAYAVAFTVIYFVGFVIFEAMLKSMLSYSFLYELRGTGDANYGGLRWDLYYMLIALCAVFVIGLYVVGLLLIVRAGINRALRYFDILFESVEGMLTEKEKEVILPPALSETALVLNDIKEASLRNERTAKAAEVRKNELVVYLAHDIKTPLTSIVGYLTLLAESPEMPLESRAKYAHITLEKAYRLEVLIEEFFEITRYNLQTIPVERSTFDARLFCEQVIDEFYPQAATRALTLTLVAPDSLLVFADANRLSRVLNNVLKNALAYASEGSEVFIFAEHCLLDSGTKWLKIMVSNQGREITPEHLSRIFEKFYRGDESRTSDSGGAGLGLAIAREIARAHGGDITAASDRGMTSFAIWIPQSENRQ